MQIARFLPVWEQDRVKVRVAVGRMVPQWYVTLGDGAVGSQLAEGGEGESEARTWRGRGVKPYYLDYVVHSQSETNDRRWWGERRSCRSVVSAFRLYHIKSRWKR